MFKLWTSTVEGYKYVGASKYNERDDHFLGKDAFAKSRAEHQKLKQKCCHTQAVCLSFGSLTRLNKKNFYQSPAKSQVQHQKVKQRTATLSFSWSICLSKSGLTSSSGIMLNMRSNSISLSKTRRGNFPN